MVSGWSVAPQGYECPSSKPFCMFQQWHQLQFLTKMSYRLQHFPTQPLHGQTEVYITACWIHFCAWSFLCCSLSQQAMHKLWWRPLRGLSRCHWQYRLEVWSTKLYEFPHMGFAFHQVSFAFVPWELLMQRGTKPLSNCLTAGVFGSQAARGQFLIFAMTLLTLVSNGRSSPCAGGNSVFCMGYHCWESIRFFKTLHSSPIVP